MRFLLQPRNFLHCAGSLAGWSSRVRLIALQLLEGWTALWSLCSRRAGPDPAYLHRNAHSPSKPVAPGSSEKSATEDEEQVSWQSNSILRTSKTGRRPMIQSGDGALPLAKARPREHHTPHSALLCFCHRQHTLARSQTEMDVRQESGAKHVHRSPFIGPVVQWSSGASAG